MLQRDRHGLIKTQFLGVIRCNAEQKEQRERMTLPPSRLSSEPSIFPNSLGIGEQWEESYRMTLIRGVGEWQNPSRKVTMKHLRFYSPQCSLRKLLRFGRNGGQKPGGGSILIVRHEP